MTYILAFVIFLLSSTVRFTCFFFIIFTVRAPIRVHGSRTPSITIYGVVFGGKRVRKCSVCVIDCWLEEGPSKFGDSHCRGCSRAHEQDE